MANYDALLSILDVLRKRTSRFRRVAMHLHSPDSYDWNKTGDRTRNDRNKLLAPGGEAAFITELKAHFDLVAITDHMKCSYASRVSKGTLGEDAFRVLPGMEVNVQPEAALSIVRLHLLVIMPEGATPEQFARLFAALKDIPDDDHRRGQEEVTGIAVADWIKRVHVEGGICIAAHVDSRQGIRRHFRQTARDVVKTVASDGDGNAQQEADISAELKEFLFRVGFDAIEVAKPADQRHYRWYSQIEGCEVGIPVTMKLDAHCFEDCSVDERTTWIKMTSLSLGGLRDALRLPETRIRFKSDLPVPPSPRLLGLEIVGDDKSFFDRVHLAFAENLNCLIGPRGSGKSTIVEALRYVFGYNRTLAELDSANKLSERIRSMQTANLSNCLIRAVYRTRAQEVRVLEATFDPKEDYVTRVFSADGEPVNVANVEKCGEYPLRLFGWSEIETLGREPARQRELLDRLVPDLAAVKDERAEHRRQLQANRAEIERVIIDLKTHFAEQGGALHRYTEYKTAFEKLNTPEVKKHFAALDLAQAKLRVLELVNKNVSELQAKLAALDAVSFREGVEALLSTPEQALRNWWLTEELAKLKVVDAETDVQKHLTAAGAVLKDFAELIGQHITLAKQEIEGIQAQLRTAFADDSLMQRIADLRKNAEKRLRDASALRDAYLKTWAVFKEKWKARCGIAARLTACHERIAGIRSQYNTKTEQKLNEYFAERMKISLRFIAGGDMRLFADALEKQKFAASFAKQYKSRRVADALVSGFNPVSFVEALIGSDAGRFVGSHPPDDPSNPITKEEAVRAREAWQPWMKDEAADVGCLVDDGTRVRQVMQLQEVEWDDHESILLNDRPVGELSPGQRSSAMLPLIALAEQTPLVIDQPEDNLDNRLIGQVLTNILADLKERRQIIVCTHNPNIVVSGDAEQVVVLNALSDRRGVVERHGSIDNADIVQSVIDIMEGGAEAFRARQQRYGTACGAQAGTSGAEA